MYPVSFNYHKPSSVDEAIRMLSQNPSGKFIAGGQSLVPSMKLRLASPGDLIDISSIAELEGIREEGGNLVIGAGVTHGEIEHSDLVKNHAACLAESAGLIGDVMIRNMGTIGGSIAHADPAADYPGVLVALDAQISIQGAGGSRQVAAKEFFTGFFETALQENEMVTGVTIPSHRDWKSCYVKFPNPASRYPIVGCAVLLKMSGSRCESAKVGFSGVGFSAFRDQQVEQGLSGKDLDSATINSACSAAAEGIEVLEDSSADADYRKAMAKLFASRAISGLV